MYRLRFAAPCLPQPAFTFWRGKTAYARCVLCWQALPYQAFWARAFRPYLCFTATGYTVSAILVLYSDRVHGALMWMVGGLAARSWPHVEIILPYAVVGFILAVCGARYLNILQLGDDVAKGLGVNVELVLRQAQFPLPGCSGLWGLLFRIRCGF